MTSDGLPHEVRGRGPVNVHADCGLSASLIRYVAEIAKHDFAEEALREAQE